jgi:hypothetical protein
MRKAKDAAMYWTPAALILVVYAVVQYMARTKGDWEVRAHPVRQQAGNRVSVFCVGLRAGCAAAWRGGESVTRPAGVDARAGWAQAAAGLLRVYTLTRRFLRACRTA